MTAAVTPPAGQERIVFLDYLRIFAFASVFAGHKFAGPVQEMAQQAGLAGAAARALWPFIEGGGAGVVVFFLVSGSVISEVLQREGAALFLLRRVFRIYPLYVTAVLGEWLLVNPPATGGERLAQLLLAGDFTGAPYALAGVEWTLRLEMLFYAWMALLRLANLTRPARGAAWLGACALLTLTLHVAGPVAAHTPWARGYVSLYMPFLFVGCAVWLLERRAIGWPLALAFTAAVWGLYRLGLHAWQPQWLQARFVPCALGLFMAAWLLRRRLPAWPWVLALSELTYAVYLTHNWLFDALRQPLQQAGWSGAAATAAALLALAGICWLLTRLVERPGVRLGRWLAARQSGGA